MSAKEYLPEKFLLFKACRIFEDQLLELLKQEPGTIDEEARKNRELHAVYVQLGNINLLADDFARALSAYQRAYRSSKDFWKDPSGLYGLGVTYLHFRAYKAAIEAFCQLIYCHPYIDIVTEVHARLGIAFKCLEDFPHALKHLLIALDDPKELQLVPKYQLRFHIAHCYDGSGDFRRAIDEYRRLITDHERNQIHLPVDLLALIYRQLGWISLRSRENEFKEEIRSQKLREAEQQLLRARELAPTDSKTNCYLGLCYSEQTTAPLTATVPSTPPQSTLPSSAGGNSVTNGTPNSVIAGKPPSSAHTPTIPAGSKQQQVAADKAQDAFISYRSAIDSDESDANTWCSIGVLYQQQNQPIDALQAFACAVQLNDKHSAAWTELGRLYEAHRQYNECLHCYRKALQYNPVAPEILRARVGILEKEFGTSTASTQLLNYLQQSQTGGGARLPLLPPLENAWQLGIPAQVRQRLSDLHKQQENRYREGSPLWKMSELAAHAMRQSFYDLDPTQRQIMQVLKLNKKQLEHKELALLNELEDRYNLLISSNSHGEFDSSLCSNGAADNKAYKSDAPADSRSSANNSRASTSLDNDQRASPRQATGRAVEDAQLKVQSSGNGDELKLRISRTTTSTQSSTSGLPYITEDDLADVLGDDYGSNAVSAHSPKSSPRSAAGLKRRADGQRLSHGSAPGTSSPNQEKQDDAEDESYKSRKVSVTALKLQEQRISSSANLNIADDLPPAFSLLAPVHVPITVSSAEVFDMCKKRRMRSEDYRPIFDECVPSPRPPEPPKKRPTKEGLLLKTPHILVDNAREALTSELQNFCYNSPIALVHGLTAALKIDLSQFSTKSLIQTAPDHEVEVRTQYKMPGDTNLDHLGVLTWNCHSTKSFTTVSRYGQYQAESFRYSLKEETEKLKQTTSASQQQHQSTVVAAAAAASTPRQGDDSSLHTVVSVSTSNQTPNGGSKRRKATGIATATNGNGIHAVDAAEHQTTGFPLKTIKFGTNVDLSDERKFHAQLRELNKMPAFCRISAACNMLTHLGHTVLGMNTVQLYMKVPGCRTPGHLENNSFASININIGPGECEWFAVPYEYWPVIEQMCKKRNIDFLKGAWWPSTQDLLDAQVPCYRFIQKAGDMVWVGGGCVHWVQATGWCNNVAWNVGPMTANQLEMALYAHEWNRLNSYRSLVPMQHLAWQLARDVRFSNQTMFNVTKNILIRSLAYCRMIADFVERNAKMPIKYQSRQKGETAHYCFLCDIEVFNLLFVKEISNKFRVFCVQCARKNNIDDYVVLQQITFDELAGIFDRFQLHPSKAALIC